MLTQLDLQPGLQDLTDEIGQQAALAGEFDTLITGPGHELFSPLAHHRRITHRRRGCPASRDQRPRVRTSLRCHRQDPLQPTAISRGPSDHAAYTKFLTDPHGAALARASYFDLKNDS